MATIANWNGHTFEVSPTLIRGFENLTLKGGCDTDEKTSGKQKYVAYKNSTAQEIGLDVKLSALTGVTNVFGEAQTLVSEAANGASAYFYMGEEKLVPAPVMLTGAEVSEIVTMPARGSEWISCTVKLTLKQNAARDGEPAKTSVRTGSGTGGSGAQENDKVSDLAKAIKNTRDLIDEAKEKSLTQKNKNTKGTTQTSSSIWNKITSAVNSGYDAAVQMLRDTAKKYTPTSQRAVQNAMNKISAAGGNKATSMTNLK